ncbi:N-acyl-D-amino acid deacylase [Rhodohalobacter sp. SW132]|uniref:N-acyl-D-amino-acid deacylase family protein n=1 Tax=Rhodohalobacter sp. SW132 TaxID=2293433 RepID=UPI000E21C87C|nr:amidohydrolase family protein [Rhodohalobacter sp. SW132]REL38961.1 N-acyl-D-amino acid deacylase [Rhodohalobacter sp. SW132]
MIQNLLRSALLFLSLLLISCTGSADDRTYDLLITNASIADGTGGEITQGNILVHNGVIEAVGEIDPDRSRVTTVIDADGRIVSPGFIDTHSHGNPLDTPRFDNFLSMGVTTVSLGQDGRSPGLDDVNAWMDEVDQTGTGPNIVYFAGHNSLRQAVDAPRITGLDSSYIEEMQTILQRALEAGAFGLTTGLEYDHGTFADMDELVALAEPVADAGALVMSHMRSEDDDEIEASVRELISQGRGSGANVHASHIKIVFGDDPGQAESVLALMDEAREDGVQITADVYPYTASFTGIAIVFPEWALPPNDFDEVVENRRGELAEYLRNRVNLRNGPEATLFGTDPWAGMTLAEVADELDKPFEDVLIDDIGPRGASAAYFVMDEEVMKRFMLDPHVMISSDGSPTMRHPRGYGSFAKIIRQYINEENLMPLEEAIYKMSGLPAETLGLTDTSKTDTPRGLIREGFAADLLIFDPADVRDNATFEDPHQYAEGFEWVFVNGTAVIDEGVLNQTLPAGVIRRKISSNSY